MIKAYLPTCDKYLSLVEANIITMEKYWPKEIEVNILGYQSPQYKLPDNYNFISLGHDRGKNFWSDDLRQFFENLDETSFIYINDDCLLLKKVEINDILNLVDLMSDNIGRINLSGCVSERKYSVVADNIIESSQREMYRISTQYSIWNTTYFLKYLIPGLTPWQFEIMQSEKAKGDGYQILGTKKNHPVCFSHICKQGKLIEGWYKAVRGKEILEKELMNQVKPIIDEFNIQ